MLEKFHTILHNISSCLVASASFASVTRYLCPTNRDIYTVFATRVVFAPRILFCSRNDHI